MTTFLPLVIHNPPGYWWKWKDLGEIVFIPLWKISCNSFTPCHSESAKVHSQSEQLQKEEEDYAISDLKVKTNFDEKKIEGLRNGFSLKKHPFTVAGVLGATAQTVSASGPATSTTMANPCGMWGDTIGNLYVTENSGYRLKQINQVTNNMKSIAGTGVKGTTPTGLNGDGGKPTSASFGTMYSVVLDTQGNTIFIADGSNKKIRMMFNAAPTSQPSEQPSSMPSTQPVSRPSSDPTSQPSALPSNKPSNQPSSRPTRHPTAQPSSQPNNAQPSTQPSNVPTVQPTTDRRRSL